MMTDIQQLMDKYFEGNTSTEEEKRLRQYLSKESNSDDLKVYASLFRYLDDEATAMKVLNEIANEEQKAQGYTDTAVTPKRKSPLIVRSISAAAAVILLIVMLTIRPHKETAPLNESFVWVDGKKITDQATVRKYAESSFGKVQSDNDIIEDQLRFMLE